MYYVYKITNIIDKKIYVGVSNNYNKRFIEHSKSDFYLGRSIKKHGKENFKIEVVESFESEKDAYLKERNIVTESFIKRKDTYNLKEGGNGGWTYVNDNNLGHKFTKEEMSKGNLGRVTVKDKEGNTLKVNVEDERYKKGELLHNTKGMTVIKDKYGVRQVSIEEAKKDGLKGVVYGTVSVENIKTGERLRIPTEVYQNNKDLYKSLGILTGAKNGRALKIKVYNLRGELVFESYGDFSDKCREFGLEEYLLKKSYQTGEKVKSKNARKLENRKLDGWYAIKIKKGKEK